MKLIAFDPDFHSTSYAVIKDGRLTRVGVIRTSKKLKGLAAIADQIKQSTTIIGYFDLVVVEVPKAYPRSKVQPNDLIGLAIVAGAVANSVCADMAQPAYLLAYPQQWKGTVDKGVLQRRICTKLGWHYTKRGKLTIPGWDDGPESIDGYYKLRDADWFHVLDAIGLGLWAYEQHQLKQRIGKATDRAKRRLSTR